MKTSLTNVAEEGSKSSPEPSEVALAEVEETLPAAQAPVALAIGTVAGDIGSRDLIIPRLNITQNVGDLSETFEGGDLVYNKETVLAAKEVPINLTVLSIKKTFEQRLAYDPNGPRPEVYDTVEEVVAAGHWIDWRNNEPPPVKEVATMLVFLEEPEGVDALGFNHKFGDKRYALALWTLRGTAYNRAAKKIFSASRIELAADGILYGSWVLHTERAQVGGNWIFVPVLRLTGKNPPELVEFIREGLSQ